MATACITNPPATYQIQHRRSTFDYWAQVFMTVGIPRTSELRTPIMRIEDHQDEILTCGFHPFGELLLSSGRDKQIHICRVYEEEEDVLVMSGHTGPVMEARFSRDGLNVYSCSQDKSLAIWDTHTGLRVNHLEGHTGGVNSVQYTRMGSNFLCSGSNDGTVRIWDVRENVHVQKLAGAFRVTSTCFNQTGDQVIFAGLDRDISIWDIRKNEVVSKVHGHIAAITGISLSPCGSYLLSHSIDDTLRVCDMRPDTLGETYLEVLNQNEYLLNGNLLRCAWSPDCKKISAGSLRWQAFIWDAVTGEILNELDGHESNINATAFHPTEPIFMSSASDGYLFLHEIKD